MSANPGPPDAARAEAAIRRFLDACRQPALHEPGEPPLALEASTHLLEWRGGRLILQAWDENRNLTRRVTAVRREQPGRLELFVARFGKREGELALVDLARGNRSFFQRHGERQVLREHFRRFLRRQFPGWRVAEISSEANLHESLSPAYPRALLKKGPAAWAAIAAPPEPDRAGGVLSFALIWLDYLRRREPRLAIEGLAVFVPDGLERATCLRLAFLNPAAAEFAVFVYSPEGSEERVDPRDYGNLETRLENLNAALPARPVHVDAWVERLAGLPAVERIALNDGGVSLRVRGLEFARATRSELLYGIEHKTAAREENLGEIEAIAAQIARLRSPDAAGRENPIYRLQPEHWLESQVRAGLEQIDATLRPAPVYGQVPAFAGGESGVIDLLAADRDGGLAVLELKAGEDLHLPLQALDYWMRVRWHLEQGHFTERGYFPGLSLRSDPPRILLVAPALEYHPTTETILRFLSPSVEVERIGLGVEWRRELQVLFRVRGAQKPAY